MDEKKKKKKNTGKMMQEAMFFPIFYIYTNTG